MGASWPGRECRVSPCVPSLPSSSQYFTDVAEADSWLQEQQSALESASFGQDQVATEALLRQHLRLERSVRTFGTELRRLDEQAQVATALQGAHSLANRLSAEIFLSAVLHF